MTAVVKEPIRVLHVIDSLDLGGAQTVLRHLLHALDRSRYAPEVAAMHGQGVFREDFAKLGVPVHSLSPHRLVPWYVPSLMQLLRTRKPHIVHCHLFGANWIAKPIAALCGVPVRISHDHCNDAVRYESAVARALDTWTNRLSTHVCAVSASTRDFLLEHEGLPPERVSVIYNGVDLERFDPQRVPARREAAQPLIVGVGRLHPQKDFSTFLQVAARLAARDPRVRFVVAGEGPEEAMLRAQANALGLGERLRFAGHVQDMPALYASADLLLLTSRYEGTPMTVLEAMAMHVPVVASHLDGLAEALVSGEDCFLAPPGDVEAFATCVERLLGDATLRANVVAQARRKVEARFSARGMTQQVEALYERCLHGSAHA